MHTNRILIIMNNPLGGVGSYVIYNVSYLSKYGYEFSFLAPEGAAFDSFKNQVEMFTGVKFINAPVKNKKAQIWQTVRKEIKKLKEQLKNHKAI